MFPSRAFQSTLRPVVQFPPANCPQTEKIFSSCEVLVDRLVLQLFKVGGRSCPKLWECVLLLQNTHSMHVELPPVAPPVRPSV